MGYRLNWFEKAKADYHSLDGSQLIQVDKGLERILAKGMLAGTPLHGNLSQCREIKHKRLGLRIIFKENRDTGEIDVIDIIIIGQRAEKKVFRDAASRLKE